MANEVEPDVPLGIVGQLVGLGVFPPELHAGEVVRWSVRANRLQQKVGAVGGRLYLTNHRLIFCRNRFESLLGGREWNAPLGELTAAEPAGGLRTIRIDRVDGGVERFIVAKKDQTAATIDAAIQESKDQ